MTDSEGLTKVRRKTNMTDQATAMRPQRQKYHCRPSDNDKTRQDKARQGTRQDKTRHDKTRQDKTQHDTTRQDKTRQDKTRKDEK
jgi:hypothetical protein